MKVSFLFGVAWVCVAGCKTKNETAPRAAPSSISSVIPGQVAARAASKLEHFQPVPAPSKVPELTAQQELDQLLSKLVSSGAATRELTERFAAARARWPELVRQLHVALGNSVCYQRGCTVTTTAADEASINEATLKMTQDPSFLAWPGSKFRSGVIDEPTKPGRKQAVWIFYVD